MAWSLAPSLVILRQEINQRWPHRDKASDGTIGDTAHQLERSDHNPNTRGRVDAIDIDNTSIDVWAVFARIKKHPSARYFIYQGHLYHRLRGWKAESYSGPSPHREHFHLSIDQAKAAEDDTRPWGLEVDDMAYDDDARNTDWATTNRTYALISGKDAVYTIGKTQRKEPNVLAADLKEIKERLAALSDQSAVVIDYDKLASAVLKAVLSK